MKKLSFKSLILTFLVGAFFGLFAGIPLHAGVAFVSARVASASFGVMPEKGVAYNAVDISAITDYAEANQRDLIASLVNGLDIAQDILVIPNVKNKINLTKLTTGNGFRPYSRTKEFKSGQLVFTNRQLITQTGKREIQIDFRDFKNSYLAHRTTPGNGANKDFNSMTFAQFVWAEVIKGLQREMNDETAYFGFDKADAVAYSGAATYDPGDIITYTQDGVLEYFLQVDAGATTAGQSPDTHPAKWRNVTARAVVPGLKSFIDEAIADTDISEVTTGAISDGTTAKAAFKELFRSFGPAYKRSKVIIHASFTDCEHLLDGLEDITKYTMPDVSALVKMGLIPIPGTNFNGWAKPATWLGDSRRLIAEPMAPGGYGYNLVMGTDLLSDANQIAQTKELWTIDAGIAVDLGFQIQDLDALKVGDQE